MCQTINSRVKLEQKSECQEKKQFFDNTALKIRLSNVCLIPNVNAPAAQAKTNVFH